MPQGRRRAAPFGSPPLSPTAGTPIKRHSSQQVTAATATRLGTPRRGGVYFLQPTGDQGLDDNLRQLTDYIVQEQSTVQKLVGSHSAAISDLRSQTGANMQRELSTQGQTPLNIQGLIGVPAVLAKVPVNNSGAAANLQGNAHSGGDPGPASNTVAKYKQFTDVDGTVFYIPLFQ